MHCRLSVIFALQILTKLVKSCPLGAEYCYPDVDFFGNDLMYTPNLDEDQCIAFCRTLPGCVGGATQPATLACFCKRALGGPGVSMPDNTVAKTCNSTSRCGAMQNINSYFVSQLATVQCTAIGAKTYFGDFNGDGICDVVCWDQFSIMTKWVQGSQTLMFVKPNTTGNDGYIGLFCFPLLEIEVRDVNNDGKDDLLCVGTDEAMMSDENGLNPGLIVPFDPDENTAVVPEECLEQTTTLPICQPFNVSNGIVTYDGEQNHFDVSCNGGYTLRGSRFIGCTNEGAHGSGEGYYTMPFPLCRKTSQYVTYNLYMGTSLMALQTTANTVATALNPFRIVVAKGALHCASLCHADRRCISAEREEDACKMYGFQAKSTSIEPGNLFLLIPSEISD